MSSPRLARGRSSEVGRIYSVTTICHRRSPRFGDARCVECLAMELRRLQNDGAVDHLAWIAMPDHFHWLFVLRAGTLPEVVALLKGRVSRGIDMAGPAASPFWQPGYFDHALRCNDDVARHVRYVIENPVRAGLVASPLHYPHWWCAWDPFAE
ncbi:MAG: REP-associated tyrosine transposase [Lysobacteraceae bacterium]